MERPGVVVARVKELTIHSPRAARPRDCDTVIRLCADRRADLAPLVTGRFPLSRVGEALAATAGPQHLKVILEIP